MSLKARTHQMANLGVAQVRAQDTARVAASPPQLRVGQEPYFRAAARWVFLKIKWESPKREGSCLAPFKTTTQDMYQPFGAFSALPRSDPVKSKRHWSSTMRSLSHKRIGKRNRQKTKYVQEGALCWGPGSRGNQKENHNLWGSPILTLTLCSAASSRKKQRRPAYHHTGARCVYTNDPSAHGTSRCHQQHAQAHPPTNSHGT